MAAVVAIAALFVSTTASAATTVQKVPIESEGTLCNGDTVHMSGTLLESLTLTRTPSGGTIIADHLNPQGIRGVDTTTGIVYHDTGVTREIAVSTPPGGATLTYMIRSHLQATKGAESFIFIMTGHLTITPDGTTTALHYKFSSSC